MLNLSKLEPLGKIFISTAQNVVFRNFSWRGRQLLSSKSTLIKSDLYRIPVCEPPTIEQIAQIADDMKIPLTNDDLGQVKATFDQFLKCYETFQEVPEPKPVVKYPRTPGYTPNPDENPYNAWHVKTDIQGANKGKLFGKTIALKDNISLAGVPMAGGSRLLEGYIPEIDATVVTRILDEGGQIIGKTSCSDLSDDSASFSGNNGPVPNFFNPSLSAGGSSSGSAVVVAAREADMALGTDTAGSIRIPACNTGIVGMKPTFGLVPTTGMLPLERTLDHIGPMTRNVYDAALLLEVIAGYDGGMCHKQYPGIQSQEYTKCLTEGLKGLKIGILKEGFEKTEKDVAKLVKESAYSMRGVGATVEEVSIPLHSKAWNVLIIICAEGIFQSMYRGYSSGPNWKGFYQTTLQDYIAKSINTRPHDMGPFVKFHFLFGAYQERYYHHRFHAISQNIRRSITEAYDKALKDFDVLILPTVPFKPQELPLETDPLDEKLTKGVEKLYEDHHYSYISWNTLPFAASGHPALSINAGFSQQLPIATMIVGRHFDEETVLKVAYNLEQTREKGYS